jgi:dsDNA-binding SOS-regulon protein
VLSRAHKSTKTGKEMIIFLLKSEFDRWQHTLSTASLVQNFALQGFGSKFLEQNESLE